MVYSGDGIREGVGNVRGGRGDGNSSKGVGGVWGDIGDGNGRQGWQPVSDGANGGVRDSVGEGNGGWRKRAREVSSSKGGRVGRLGL